MSGVAVNTLAHDNGGQEVGVKEDRHDADAIQEKGGSAALDNRRANKREQTCANKKKKGAVCELKSNLQEISSPAWVGVFWPRVMLEPWVTFSFTCSQYNASQDLKREREY